MHQDEVNQFAEQQIEQALRSRAQRLNFVGRISVLPESLGQLTGLRFLTISGNLLTRLPESIGQLTQLQKLTISCTQLTFLPESLGQLAQLKELHLKGNKLTCLPESLCNLKRLLKLRVDDNQLTFLPETIGQLESLEILFLQRNQIEKLPASFGYLASLRKLYLFQNNLSSLPESIGQLGQLQVLNINSNHLKSLPESFGNLSQLHTLNLDNNQLVYFPESIGRLSQLQTLALSDNQLTELPESLGQLSQLQTLALSRNQLKGLPESLGQLSQLQTFAVSDNQLTGLPEAIGKLVKLQYLYVHNNQITELPESLSDLTNLQILSLVSNKLSQLSELLGQLTQLKELKLSGNRLTKLPDSLCKLKQLQQLAVSENRLIELPKRLNELKKLQTLLLNDNRLAMLPDSLYLLAAKGSLVELFLHGNPSLGLPDEVLGPPPKRPLTVSASPKPPHEILDYYFSTRGQEGQQLRELRLIVVGRPKVGKTSLIKRLRGLPMNPHEDETHGIDILSLDLQCQDGPIYARVWDFGGQHVLHAMHEFFLRRRCLYLLVVEQRTNDVERDLTYWLQLIRSYAGDAPVVVAVNQSKGVLRSLARSTMERDYGPILAWVPTECAPEEHEQGANATIDELRKALTDAAFAMPEPKALFPKKWLEVKKWLEEMKEPYLDYELYAKQCELLNEKSPEQQAALAAAMDELGVALNYARDPRLRDTTVLRPNWLANGIYTLLRANMLTPQPLVSDGVLTTEKVGQVFEVAERSKMLATAEYPREKWAFLLRLMNLFQLSFPLDELGEQYLVPTLLSADEPEGSEEPLGPNVVRLRYEFAVVPKPLIGRILVRLFALIDGRKMWQKGARLRYATAQGRLWADLSETYVYVTVEGEEHDRNELLEIIRETLKVLFYEYERLRVVEQWWYGNDWVPRGTLEKFKVLPREDSEEEEEEEETTQEESAQ